SAGCRPTPEHPCRARRRWMDARRRPRSSRAAGRPQRFSLFHPQLALELFDDFEVLLTRIGHVQDVEILFHAAHAAEAIVAVRARKAPHEIRRPRAEARIHAISGGVTGFTPHAMRAVRALVRLRAVGAAIATRAALAEHAARAGLAIFTLIAADVGALGGVITLQAVQLGEEVRLVHGADRTT